MDLSGFTTLLSTIACRDRAVYAGSAFGALRSKQPRDTPDPQATRVVRQRMSWTAPHESNQQEQHAEAIMLAIEAEISQWHDLSSSRFSLHVPSNPSPETVPENGAEARLSAASGVFASKANCSMTALTGTTLWGTPHEDPTTCSAELRIQKASESQRQAPRHTHLIAAASCFGQPTACSGMQRAV